MDNMNSHRLVQACTMLYCLFSLAVVLLAVGVQFEVFLVLTLSPGFPSYTVNSFSGMSNG